ncbi:MAG: hypothetical protein AAGG01_13605, partial [Planctomycetota bacterium]
MLRVGGPEATATRFFYAQAGERPLIYAARSVEGETRLPLLGGALDVLIAAPGFAPRLLEAVAHDVEIELLPLPRVTVQITEIDDLGPSAAANSGRPAYQLIIVLEPEHCPWSELLPAHHRGVFRERLSHELGMGSEESVTLHPRHEGPHRIRFHAQSYQQFVMGGPPDLSALPSGELAPLDVTVGGSPLGLTMDLSKASFE